MTHPRTVVAGPGLARNMVASLMDIQSLPLLGKRSGGEHGRSARKLFTQVCFATAKPKERSGP